MTICPLALLFELELKAANERCANCGRVGLTVIQGTNAKALFRPPLFSTIVQAQCLRCEAVGEYAFDFANPKFAY